MKRLILLFLPFVSVFINAEELRFVTVLSSPVGTFNRLEAVNPETPANSPIINFCTSIGNGGTVTLESKSDSVHPTMKTVNMSSNTELGGNGANYVLNKIITMKDGGTLKGSRLLAQTLYVSQLSAGKSENLYTDNLTVVGAKTGKLHVNGTESYIETSHTDPGMVWSNQYQTDNACKEGNGCAKQYLLKQQGTVSTGAEGEIECTESSAGGCGAAYDSSGNPSYYWRGTPLCSEVNGWDKNFEGKCAYIKECQKMGVSSLIGESNPGNCRGTGEYHGNVSCCSSSVSQSERNSCGSEISFLDNVNEWAFYSRPENAPALCEKLGRTTTYPTSKDTCFFYYSINGNCLRFDLKCKEVVIKKEAIVRTCKRK